MNIYKLKYTDLETATTDLIEKNIIREDNTYKENTHAVVYIGFIGNVEGYHIDVMTTEPVEFETAIEVKNPVHSFLGF